MAFLLSVMVLITFTQVTLRYFIGTGLLWAVEVTGYLFVWLVLLGASYLVKHQGHVGVDMLVRTFSPAVRRMVALLAVSLCLAYSTLLLMGGYNYVSILHRVGVPAQDIPLARWLLLLPVPVGLALLVVRFGQLAFMIWSGKKLSLLTTQEIVDDEGRPASERIGS